MSFAPLRLIGYEATRVLPEVWAHQLLCLRRRRDWQRSGVIFIHVPRAAGTSVARALYGRALGHYTAQEVAHNCGDLVRKIPSFAIVRNPWSRLLSAYRFVTRAAPGEMAIRSPERYQGGAFRSFEKFVLEWLVEQDLKRSDYVFRPQWRFVLDEGERSLVHHIGRFEDVSGVETYLSDLLKRAVQFERRNVSAELSGYRDHYTSEMKRIAGTIYSDDVRLFGYDF